MHILQQLQKHGFRPQQGLTIMNDSYNEWLLENNYWFPSPTGVNHYELLKKQFKEEVKKWFPSPTGVNHYESLPTKP